MDINQTHAKTIAQALNKQSENSKFLKLATVLPLLNKPLSLMISSNKTETPVANTSSKNASNKSGPLKPATNYESIYHQLASNVVVFLEGTDPFCSAIPPAAFNKSHTYEDTEQKPHAHEAFDRGGRLRSFNNKNKLQHSLSSFSLQLQTPLKENYSTEISQHEGSTHAVPVDNCAKIQEYVPQTSQFQVKRNLKTNNDYDDDNPIHLPIPPSPGDEYRKNNQK